MASRPKSSRSRFEDLRRGVANLAREFRRSKTGMTGLTILIILTFIAVFFPIIGDPEAIDNWTNLEYWQDNPKKAPPCWAASDAFRTIIITRNNTSPTGAELVAREWMTPDGRKVSSFALLFTVEKKPPTNINVEFRVSYKKTTRILILLERPDGQVVYLTKNPFEGRGTSVKDVFGVATTKFNGTVSKQLSSYVTKPKNVENFLRPWLESNGYKIGTAETSVLTKSGFDILFAKLTPNLFNQIEYLPGRYNLTIAFVSKDPDSSFEVKKIVLVGGCFGLAGSDKYGRDLLQGLLYGVKWALIIGLLASLASTLIGGVYGVVSGYAGGVVDEVMLRIAQVIYSIPVLPILILLFAIIKPSIWILIGLLVVFGWPGMAIVTRSMALQLKEETYVEAARAIGAGHFRLVFLYILPQILPYMFASIALSVPGAVITEASLSFLGLGDPTILTWGKILNEAQNAAATINGYWWWVLLPGIMITLVGTTFILIGQALDTILNPRLKR